MKLFNKLTLIIVFLGGINSSLSFSVDVSSWPINSVGANSKLVLRTDFIVPPNSTDATNGGDIFNGDKVFVCTIKTRESSLQTRVLSAGTEIVFTGAVKEYIYRWDEQGITTYFLQVAYPETIAYVGCITHSFTRDKNGYMAEGSWRPRNATLGDLKWYFRGAAAADFFLAEPVEIGNP